MCYLRFQTAPRVAHYRFSEGQSSVRLIVSSDSEVCATLSVQNYSVRTTFVAILIYKFYIIKVVKPCCTRSFQCPIPQTPTDVSTNGQRLTMMRSGAMQLYVSRVERCS